uniref:von Willebrand factor A domain containing 5B2 n=1 Tax=Hippocampus comes TaxID=109280 RepID=A0A3Q2YGH5_HIPCM
MVGLRNRSTWDPLLLKSSCIKSCAVGCSLAITAHLTYANADKEPVEVFVYPLGETEVVVGFEAAIAGRLMGVQIQNRGKLKDCCLDCCPGTAEGREWNCCGSSSLDMQCTNHLILDEDLERNTFIIGTGVIGPMDIVSIIMKTSFELPTLENGAIHIVYPTLLTPIVTHVTASKSENGGKSEETATSCFSATSGKQERVLDSEQQYCAHAFFNSPAASLAPYELNFQLLVRGACLLALESPTHALRADADPSAQSASATYITLAQEHPYDRHIEIILHLEPHSPLVIIENGRLSFSQYEQHILSRRDFIRCTRKDPEPERKVEFMRKRYHKDILNNPVLMLNFCPDFLAEPLELNKATREILFLVDWNGGISGTNIRREALVVALKSLPSGTLLNIVGFSTPMKPLFSASKLCTDVTLMQASEYVQRMRANMRGINLLGALSWVYQQPMQRTYPRQIFIITDGSKNNAAKVLELVRRNTCAGSLKKALEPVLTDVRIDWYLPENMEALLSPNEIPALYPGNRLIGYCTLYDMTTFKAKKTENDLEEAMREISREISSEFSCAKDDSHWRQKSLARSTMAARSFSSPQGELEMHRLRRALERVSFDQTLGGRLDESDGETKPPETLSRRSLNDSGLLFPASPLDWDNFTDPDYLFTAVPLEDPQPGQCRSLIHGLLCGRPVTWEATVNLSAKRYRVKAIQTSKHCNIVCMYTAFTIIDSNPNKSYSAGVGRRPISGDCEEGEDTWNSTRDDTPTSPCSLTSWESFPLGRLRSSISSGRQVPLKSHCLSAETDKQPENEAPDYLPLVSPSAGLGSFSAH